MSGQHTLLGVISTICITLCLGCTQAPPSPTPTPTASSNGLPSATSVEIEIDEPTETEPVAWAATLAPSSATAGGQALLVVRAKIAEGWHIYAAEGSTGVGRPTKFQLTLPPGFTAAEQWELPHAEVKSTALGEVSHYKKTATFAVPIQLAADASGAAEIGCEISFQSCTDKSCLPPTSTQLSIPVAIAE